MGHGLPVSCTGAHERLTFTRMTDSELLAVSSHWKFHPCLLLFRKLAPTAEEHVSLTSQRLVNTFYRLDCHVSGSKMENLLGTWQAAIGVVDAGSRPDSGKPIFH